MIDKSRAMLTIESERDALVVEESSKHPCWGGCGKSWDEAGGGWMTFESDGEGGTTTTPGWRCDSCDTEAEKHKSWPQRIDIPNSIGD